MKRIGDGSYLKSIRAQITEQEKNISKSAWVASYRNSFGLAGLIYV